MNKRKVYSFTVVVGITVAIAIGCGKGVRPQVGKTIDDQLAELFPAHIRYKPARSDLGPGVLLEGDLSSSGKLVRYDVLCRNVFGDYKPTEANVKMFDLVVDSETEINANIQFLEKLIQSKENVAKLDLAKFKTTKDVTIEWDDTKHEYYAKEDWFTESGSVREIPKSCRSAIDALKSTGNFDGRVFIITSAISTSSLSYKFEQSLLAGMGIEGSIVDVVKAKAGATVKSNPKGALEISGEKLYIGYANPLLVTEWAPTGQISGTSVNISAKPIDIVLE